MLYFNALLYLIVLFLIFKKTSIKENPLNFLLWSSWTICAVSGLFYENTEFRKTFDTGHDYTITPFLYLWALAFVFFLGVKYEPIYKIEHNISPIIKPMIIVISLCSYELFIENVAELFFGTVDLKNFAETRNQVFDGTLKYGYHLTVIGKFIQHYISYTFFLNPIFLFYYLSDSKKISNIYAIGLFLACINPALINLIMGARGEFIFTLIYILFVYLLSKNTLHHSVRTKITYILSMGGMASIIIFIIVTIFRFTASQYDNYSLTDWVIRYFGESMCNFNTECWYFSENTWGLNCFSTFIIEESRDFNLLELYTGVRMNVFFTMFGDLLIDFGYIPTIIITLVLSGIGFAVKPTNGTISLLKLTILSTLVYMFFTGTTIFVLLNKAGGLTGLIIFCPVLYLTSIKKQ